MGPLLLVFIAVVSIQIIFFSAFIVAWAKLNRTVSTVSNAVSVVVCAHDELENLRELLPVLLAQDHPEFEVLVVNDRSNDDTYDFLREESARDTRLRMVNVNHLPLHADAKKYGITLAVKAAKHDIILLTDADCRPATRSWITAMSSEFDEQTNFVLGFSPYVKLPGLLNLFIRFETLFTALQYLSMARLGNPYMGVGRNLAYRKSLFLNVKGFNDLLPVRGGDDDLFVNRHAKNKTTKVSTGYDAVTFSKPKQTSYDFFQQKIRHLSVGRKYRSRHKVILGVFIVSFLLAWITGLVQIPFSDELIWIISALVLRVLLLTVAVHLISKRFGHKFELWAVPFLDFLFVIYYISTGTVTLVTKKVRWKN